MEQIDYQLKLPEAELARLANRVQTDYRNALSDHNRRINRWRMYYRRWRALTDAPALGEEDASNLPVPYIRWNILTKWAKEMDSLFGDDAEVVAVPVGPSDYRKDKKIGLYMTWRVLNSMKLVNDFCVFVLRKILFGRSFSYSPWKIDTFEADGKEVTDYEGPGFEPLWPDDFIVPAEDCKNLHEFSFVIRRYRVRPDDLLRGEEEGRYQGISENWEQIVRMAQHGQQREFEGEEIKLEKDEAEGILYQRPLSSGEWLTIIEWYGRWRPLKGSQDADEMDVTRRERRQKEYVVRYLWDLHKIIGVQDLAELYPSKKNRRPFVEASMFKDGSYWSMGLAEMLLDLEDELTKNHNLATDGGEMSVGPVIFYRPASGFTPETFKYEAKQTIPVDNPATDVRVETFKGDLSFTQVKEQNILAYGERVTGQTDMNMGRQVDRPNAPRTARQTIALLEEGNVRISLDAKVLREDMAAVLSHFWDLEYMFSSEETFFRVTEDDADGLFPVNGGGAMLTREDRDGRYDFKLEFASSVYSREAKKEKALARYQLDLQNPLIVQNPQALWKVTKDAHEALGDPNFEDLVPQPPDADAPVNPKEEWTRILQGEDVHVNPMDNDELHMARHFQDLQRAEQDPHTDPDSITKLIVHYKQHLAQLQAKKVQQAVVEQAVNAAAQLAQSGALGFPNGLFGNPPNMPPGNPTAQGPNLYSGHPEIAHEQ